MNQPASARHLLTAAAPGTVDLPQSERLTDAVEAAAFRRLLQHLMHQRTDVQNIELMIQVGFCRNCLSDWYREAAEARGIPMSREAAREAVYGMPFPQWKELHQTVATPEQMAAFDALRRDS